MRFLPGTDAPTVAIVGFGYVGTCLGVVLAERGLTVTGIDSNQGLIDDLRRGRCPIPEPGLAEATARLIQGEPEAGSRPDLAEPADKAEPGTGAHPMTWTCRVALPEGTYRTIQWARANPWWAAPP